MTENFPVHPSVNEVTVAPISLRDELVQERNAFYLDKLQSSINRACTGFIYDNDKIAEQLEDGSGIDSGNMHYPGSRLNNQIIETAANETVIEIQHADTEGSTIAETTDILTKVTRKGSTGAITYRYIDAQRGSEFRSAVEELQNEVLTPFYGLAEKLQSGETQAVTKERFDLETNADLVSAFMGMPNIFAKDKIAGHVLMSSLIKGLPTILPGDERDSTVSDEGIYLDENGNVTKIIHEFGESGIYNGMYFEPGSTGEPLSSEFRLGVEINYNRAFMERGDSTSTVVEPFIETQTGNAIVSILDNEGLMPNGRLREMIEDIAFGRHDSLDKRYGNSYSELTREVAKFVNNPNRSLSMIFDGDEEAAKEAISNLDIAKYDNGPAAVFFGILQQAITRESSDIMESDVPVFDGEIHMRADACKDAESYFLNSLKGINANGENTLSTADFPGKTKMLHKLIKGKTAINTHPIKYKGVVLPAGSLFQRHVNSEGVTEYAFVRVTSFAFDDEQARDAYTWQYIDSNTGGRLPNADAITIFR